MGVAISNWRLARAVAQAGGLGVVSGTVIDRVVAYRLQEGDPEGHLRRVLARFPVPAIAQRVLDRWFVPGGIATPGAYRQTPMVDHQPGVDSLELLVVAGFAEVALAKEGHTGQVGINLLEKLQTPNPAILYGALLAGVDAVLMGAGIPREIPALLTRLAAHEPGFLTLRVEGAPSGETTRIEFSPRSLMAPAELPPMTRPPFLAIISSEVLAQSLLRSTDGQVDGFIVEGPTAGGHNAPPRGGMGRLSDLGEPVYGPRDVPDLARLRQFDRPFWLAGGYGSAEGLARARAAGAQGIQVGTPFALCAESGMEAELRARIWAQASQRPIRVFTDPLASPTGFPFKVADVPGTLSEPAVYEQRTRICNLGYLRQAYRRPDGSIGWRCPAEPQAAYLAKGGAEGDLAGRKCLCNALLATAGLALADGRGGREPALVTSGDCLGEFGGTAAGRGCSAADVCAEILGGDADGAPSPTR
jgi:NAD(P)H-dependent flavin oxidoreductase YrpB (nitropropane dioxygenase family)